MAKVIYYRHYTCYEQNFDTLDEAMRTSSAWSDYGEAYIEKIIDGETVYSRTDIIEYWENKGW